jgi:hypothetical protein
VKVIAAWKAPAPSPAHVRIDTERGETVALWTCAPSGEISKVELPWKDFVTFIGDANVGIAKHRRYVP